MKGDAGFLRVAEQNRGPRGCPTLVLTESASGGDGVSDARSDAELLHGLRGGDARSYEALWRRHSGAAYRYAHRLFPSRADDLVSESFLAIYQQVTATDKGPRYAFRSYLKAVIRNLAIKWNREAERVLSAEDLDQVDPHDGLSRLEKQSDSAEVISAFRELPERWQRVLWLAEVDDRSRPEIAKELGIRPNAVSALQRRARTGLKFQWLSTQIPLALREDVAHVARLFPQYVTEPRNAALAAEVDTHLTICDSCRDLLHSLRGGSARLEGKTLAILLGSAGLGVPSLASLTSGTTAAAVAAVTAGAGLTGWLIAGGLSVLTVSGVIVSTLLLPPAPSPAVAGVDPTTAPSVIRVVVPQTPAPTTPRPEPVEPAIGPGVNDPRIPVVELTDDPDRQGPIAPTRPDPAGPETPGPGIDPSTGGSPGVTTPSTFSGYLAPVVQGKTTPGRAVVVELAAQRYTPPVAGDGSWSFDARGLELEPGVYDYRVWTYDAVSPSAAMSGTFTVLPLTVQGFEHIEGFEDMLLSEAQTTGVVIAITGPANGTVFVDTMQGVSATITLDQSGYTRKRLVMNGVGWYHFTFRALDGDGFWGPAHETSVDVYDPDVIWGPWGPDAEDMTFDLVDP